MPWAYGLGYYNYLDVNIFALWNESYVLSVFLIFPYSELWHSASLCIKSNYIYQRFQISVISHVTLNKWFGCRHAANDSYQFPPFIKAIFLNETIYIYEYICCLQLQRESHCSTRLLQLTVTWRTDAIVWLALRSVKLLMSALLIRLTTSQSSSYSIIPTKLGAPCSRANPDFKFWKCLESNPRHHNQKSVTLRRSYVDIWTNKHTHTHTLSHTKYFI